MCTMQDDDNGLIAEKATVSTGASCMKCHQRAAVVVIRLNDPFCSECFLRYCAHKFRSSFGKSRLIRDQENVMLAFSGGQASSAMVHLVREGLGKRAQKKLRFCPTLVFIDEGSVVGLSGAETQELTEGVVSAMKETDLPFHVYKLHQVFERRYNKDDIQNNTPSKPNDVSAHMANMEVTNVDHQMSLQASSCERPSEELETRLHEALAAATSQTAKEGLLALFRQRLLVDVAKELGFSKLLLADSSTRLAVRMLSNITQGRGAHLAYEMSFADSRRSDVTIVRPMREFSAKEIAVYNRLNDVTYVIIPTFSTKQAGLSSLDSLTEQFVTTLQSQSATTVNTICRTGEKLGLAESSASEDTRGHCCMCEAPLDTQVVKSSALASTLFSQSMCQRTGIHDRKSPAEDCAVPDSHESCGNSDTSGSASMEDLGLSLCYGCQRLTHDMDDISKLPDVVTGRMSTRKVERREMRRSIGEFLLEDSGAAAAIKWQTLEPAIDGP